MTTATAPDLLTLTAVRDRVAGRTAQLREGAARLRALAADPDLLDAARDFARAGHELIEALEDTEQSALDTIADVLEALGGMDMAGDLAESADGPATAQALETRLDRLTASDHAPRFSFAAEDEESDGPAATDPTDPAPVREDEYDATADPAVAALAGELAPGERDPATAAADNNRRIDKQVEADMGVSFAANGPVPLPADAPYEDPATGQTLKPGSRLEPHERDPTIPKPKIGTPKGGKGRRKKGT